MAQVCRRGEVGPLKLDLTPPRRAPSGAGGSAYRVSDQGLRISTGCKCVQRRVIEHGRPVRHGQVADVGDVAVCVDQAGMTVAPPSRTIAPAGSCASGPWASGPRQCIGGTAGLMKGLEAWNTPTLAAPA